MDKAEYLDRASEAFFDRVPAARVLQYREQLDACRTVAREMIKGSEVEAFIIEWLQMEPVFARLHFERDSQVGETAPLCFALVARYVLSREKSQRGIYKSVDGESEQALNDACLRQLLGLTKCANVGAFGGGRKTANVGRFEETDQATLSRSAATRSARGLMAAT